MYGGHALSSGQKSAHRIQQLGPDGFNVLFLEQPNGSAILQLGIEAHEPCLNNAGRVMLDQRSRDLIRESKPLVRVPIRFHAAMHPAFDDTCILDATNVSSQLFSQDPGKFGNDFRK